MCTESARSLTREYASTVGSPDPLAGRAGSSGTTGGRLIAGRPVTAIRRCGTGPGERDDATAAATAAVTSPAPAAAPNTTRALREVINKTGRRATPATRACRPLRPRDMTTMPLRP